MEKKYLDFVYAKRYELAQSIAKKEGSMKAYRFESRERGFFDASFNILKKEVEIMKMQLLSLDDIINKYIQTHKPKDDDEQQNNG